MKTALLTPPLRVWRGSTGSRPLSTSLLLAIAALLAAAGCDEGAPSPIAPGEAEPAALAVTVLSGENQTGPVGEPLPQPLALRVSAQEGAPVEGQIVSFVVVSGGGQVESGERPTNGKGEVEDRWTLGPKPGAQRVEARAVDPDTGEILVQAMFEAEAVIPEEEDGDEAPGSALHPNEPAGFVTVSDRPFHQREENGWWTGSSSNFSIVSDPTAPVSGPTVARVRYPAGFTGGSAPAWTQHGIASHGKTSLYVSFWVKLSDNWQGHSVVDKLGYIVTHGKPVVVPAYVGGGSAPLTSQIRIQDTPDGSRNVVANRQEVIAQRGEWHQWELLLVNNTGDQANGVIRWWIDGVEVGHYEDVRFSPSSSSKVWETLFFRPGWGGAGGVVQEDMYMDMDHYYASGTN